MKRVLSALVLSISLAACPAQEQKDPAPGKDAAPAGTANKNPTAEELSSLVPASVGHIANPDVKNMPTPLNKLPFDGAATKAAATKVTGEHTAAQAAACKASATTVVRLSGAGTRVGYQSYKNEKLPVPGFFEKVEGYAVLGPKPQFRVTVDPLSLNSGDPVRDNKLLKLFFELEDDKNATFTFAGNSIEGELPKGDGTSTVTLGGKLTLHQKAVDLKLAFEVTRKGDSLTAKNKNPVELLKLANFGLIGPLKALIASCNHTHMGDSVNLTISLALVEGCD